MKSKRMLIILAVMLISFGTLAGALFTIDTVSSASNEPLPDPPTGEQMISKVTLSTDWIVVRLYYDDQEHLNAVAGELDIWSVNKEEGFAIVALPTTQYDWLEVMGYRVEIDDQLTALYQSPAAPLDPRFHYFDDFYTNANGNYIVDFMENISNTYPSLTELIDVGDAWMAGQPGEHDRDILVLRITNEDPAFGSIDEKPPFFLFATIHSREVSTPELAIRYVKYVTQGYNSEGGYGIDPDVTWLVDHNVLYVLIMQNPDGHWINEQNTGAYRRKNMDWDDGCSDPNNWGVDLNRNHSFFWGCCGGSSGSPCNTLYRGPDRASEPETQAFQNYFATVIDDQNGPNGDDELPPAAPDDAIGIFLSLHMYGDVVLWPYAFDEGGAPNNDQLETIGRKLGYYTGYYPSGFYYTVDGSTDDWTYGKFGIASLVYEVAASPGYPCGGFFAPYGCIDGIDGQPRSFWAETKPSFIYAHKIARTPYMTTYGPDTENLSIVPNTVPAGTPVDLTGTIADYRYGNDTLYPIAAAEYFIDTPGEDGTGIPISPSDGNWGETSEDVEAIIETIGLAEGQHYILVHGQNDQGDWGPFTAVFLWIETPTYGVDLDPNEASLQADPGELVTYTIQVNNIGELTDSYDLNVIASWPTDAPTSIGPITGGSNSTVDVAVMIPITATNGESDTAYLFAISQADPTISDTAILVTTANNYALELSPSAADGSTLPGIPVTYTLQLTNTGNMTDTFDITAGGLWTTTIPSVLGPLSSNSSELFDVIVEAPLSAIPGETDLTMITATSQGDTQMSGTALLTTTVHMLGPEIYPTQLTGYGDPGSLVTYTLQVTNAGEVEDIYDISIINASWDTSAPTTTGSLQPGESITFKVSVSVPEDAAGGASDVTSISITSQLPNTQPANAELTTIANNIYSLDLSALSDFQNAFPGTTITYSLQLTNTGNTTDTYGVIVTGTWPAEVVIDQGPVPSGEFINFEVLVHVPSELNKGELEITTVFASSLGNPNIKQEVYLSTSIDWSDFYIPITFSKE
jgi:uncharacterized repeat protein (TIGR01451 family)